MRTRTAASFMVTVGTLILAPSAQALEQYFYVRTLGSFCNVPVSNGPVGVSIDSSGDLYVVENARILKFTRGAASPSVVKESRRCGLWAFEGFNYRDLAVDPIGQIFTTTKSFTDVVGEPDPLPPPPSCAEILARTNGNIRKYDGSGNQLARFGPTEFSYEASTACDGSTTNPRGVWSDSLGNIFVADTDNNRIEAFDNNGGFLTKFATQTPPDDVAVDETGNVFVVYSSGRVDKFITAGGGHYALERSWGGVGSLPGQFNQPLGIAVDAAGNVYVADTGNNRIQKFNGSGSLLALFGTGPGSSNSEFNSPVSIDVGSRGDVYVADLNNDRVQVFNQDGTPPTVMGTPERLPDAGGYYNHAVKITWTGDDSGGSGIAFCDPPFTYSGPDSNSVVLTGRCTDNAGNVGSGTFTLRYDSSPPAVLGRPDSARG